MFTLNNVVNIGISTMSQFRKRLLRAGDRARQGQNGGGLYT